MTTREVVLFLLAMAIGCGGGFVFGCAWAGHVLIGTAPKGQAKDRKGVT